MFLVVGKPSKSGPRNGGATVGERQESVRNVKSVRNISSQDLVRRPTLTTGFL